MPHSKGHLNPGASGVDFHRFELEPTLCDLVRHVWIVRWSVAAGEKRSERVLGYPAFNVIVDESGASLAGVDPRLFVKELSGAGWTVGVLLRPAAGRLLTVTPPLALVSRAERLASAPATAIAAAMAATDGRDETAGHAETAGRADTAGHADTAGRADTAGHADATGHADTAGWADADAYRRTDATAAAAADADADALVRDQLTAWLRPLAERVDARGRLVNDACRLAEEDSSILRTSQLAERLGVGIRTLERLVREQTGVSPKWLIECRRLQAAATTLFEHPHTDLSALALELGYADYAHFSRRYKSVLGQTPAPPPAAPASPR